MCVAVVVPAGQRLTEEQLRAMHEQNPDSWGFAFYVKYASHVTSSQPGYVRAVKGVSDTAAMVAAYNKAVEELSGENGLEYEHLAHFRIATSGKKDHTNAHPFYIAGGMLIHNGHIAGGGNSEHSDTYQFTQMLYNYLQPGMTKEQKEYLGRLIGGYNKLAMLHNDGTHTIINEDRGSRLSNGIWVSNTFWMNRSFNFNY